jgi:tetratricopeptide (TPR) repeat protein
LLAAGANPAVKNDFGDDAVAWAMNQGHYDIAKRFTSAENFAVLARQAAEQARARAIRSVPVPDVVDEYLRMARLAETKGRRSDALAAYQKAFAALKAKETPKKVGAGDTAGSRSAKSAGEGATPSALVIRARRDQPDRQSMSFSYTGKDKDAPSIDRLLEMGHEAEAAGRTAEAIRLFREASTRIRNSHP